MASLKEHIWRAPCNNTDMKLKDFLIKAISINEKSILLENDSKNEPQEYEYIYFSSPITSFPYQMQRDIKPFMDWLRMEEIVKIQDEEVAGKNSREKKIVCNVWMGTQGVTAQTHYDSQHNFFVQLYGVFLCTLYIHR
jgi:hypothetical protein